MLIYGRIGLNNCRQRYQVNKHLARCSIELMHREKTEEEKSTTGTPNSLKRINSKEEAKEKLHDSNKEVNEELSKTEECKSNMIPIMQSKEFIIINGQNNCILPENRNSSSEEIRNDKNQNSSESTFTLISNLQTPIKSNISTNLSLNSTITDKAYVDVSDRDEESNFSEIAEKEKASKKLAY